MARAVLKFKNCDILEKYGKFLPLSKDHWINTEMKDTTVTISSGGKIVALALTCVVLQEIHVIIEDPKIFIYNDVYYIHPDYINCKILKRSPTITFCPFKGYATYYSLPDKKDVAWCYERPYEQVSEIAGLIAFYPDQVDIIVM